MTKAEEFIESADKWTGVMPEFHIKARMPAGLIYRDFPKMRADIWSDLVDIMKTFGLKMLSHTHYHNGTARGQVWVKPEGWEACKEFLRKQPESYWTIQ